MSGHIAFANTQIKDLVGDLLSGPEDTRPIVILQADEGPLACRSVDCVDTTAEYFKIRSGVLNAMYLPGVTDRLPDRWSNVNTFRFVFDHYLRDGPAAPSRPDLHVAGQRPPVRLPGRHRSRRRDALTGPATDSRWPRGTAKAQPPGTIREGDPRGWVDPQGRALGILGVVAPGDDRAEPQEALVEASAALEAATLEERVVPVVGPGTQRPDGSGNIHIGCRSIGGHDDDVRHARWELSKLRQDGGSQRIGRRWFAETRHLQVEGTRRPVPDREVRPAASGSVRLVPSAIRGSPRSRRAVTSSARTSRSASGSDAVRTFLWILSR